MQIANCKQHKGRVFFLRKHMHLRLSEPPQFKVDFCPSLDSIVEETQHEHPDQFRLRAVARRSVNKAIVWENDRC